MKKAFLAIAAVALLLATADTALADHKPRRSAWTVGVGYGGYGGYGYGPSLGIGYGTRVGSNGFVSVGYSTNFGGYGYGYPRYGYGGYGGYGYGYPAYGYGYAPVYAAPVYAAPVYAAPYYYGGGPSIGFSYTRWR